MSDRISSYHLADNPSIYEPTRNNAFEFMVSGLDKLLPAGLTEEVATEGDYILGGAEVIRLSVAEASVPHLTLETVSIKRGNSTMKFAGAPSFETMSLKINDYVGARTKDILLAWRAQAYNEATDVVNLAEEYKHDCELVEYTPDFSKKLRSWTLIGCWVKSLAEGSFSHEDHDKRSIDLTIEFDRAIPIKL